MKQSTPSHAQAHHHPQPPPGHRHRHSAKPAITPLVIISATVLGIGWGLLLIVFAEHHLWFQPHLRDVVTGPDYALAITNVQIDPRGGGPYTPGAGNEFVILTLTITNIGPQTQTFAPVVQTYLTGEPAQRFDMAPAPLSDPIPGATLRPGQSLAGQISYRVQSTAKNLVFHFEPGWPGDPDAAIRLD